MFVNISRYRLPAALWLTAGLTPHERAKLAHQLLTSLTKREAQEVAAKILPVRDIVRSVHMFAEQQRNGEGSS